MGRALQECLRVFSQVLEPCRCIVRLSRATGLVPGAALELWGAAGLELVPLEASAALPRGEAAVDRAGGRVVPCVAAGLDCAAAGA